MEILKDRLPKHIFVRLESVQIKSLKYFLLNPIAEICDLTRLSKKNVILIIETVSELLSNKFIPVTELENNCRYLKIGCESIDSILNGIPTVGITEIYGESGCGKTQIGLQLSIKVQDSECNGGLQAGAVYVCTEDVFPSKRLHQLSCCFKRREKDSINYEDNIFLEHLEDVDQLKQFLSLRLPILLLRFKIALIVIDSIAGVFRHDNESTNYIARSKDLRSIASKLCDVARHHNIAVVCINQLTSDPVRGDKPCLGLAWSNLVRLRIKISRTPLTVVRDHQPLNVREFKVIFSPEHPTNVCNFCIAGEGIVNVPSCDL